VSLPIIVLVIGVVLCLGILLGCSWTDARYDQRSRRQAAMQRMIKAEWRALQEARHAQLPDHGASRYSPGWPSRPPDEWPADIEDEVLRSHLDHEVV